MNEVLHPGTIITTNYGTGPYEVLTVTDGCTCPEYIESLKFGKAKPSEPHMHIVVRYLSDGSKGYLGGYAWKDGRLKSVWSNDEIYIQEIKEGTQLSIF